MSDDDFFEDSGDIGMEDAMRSVEEEFSEYSPRQLANYIFDANSQSAQFIYLNYIRTKPEEFQKRVGAHLRRLSRISSRQKSRALLDSKDEEMLFV